MNENEISETDINNTLQNNDINNEVMGESQALIMMLTSGIGVAATFVENQKAEKENLFELEKYKIEKNTEIEKFRIEKYATLENNKSELFKATDKYDKWLKGSIIGLSIICISAVAIFKELSSGLVAIITLITTALLSDNSKILFTKIFGQKPNKGDASDT